MSGRLGKAGLPHDSRTVSDDFHGWDKDFKLFAFRCDIQTLPKPLRATRGSIFELRWLVPAGLEPRKQSMFLALFFL